MPHPHTGLNHAKLNSVEVNILIGGRKMEPLYTFITSRELERRLPAMIAHLKPVEETSELRFTEATVATVWFQWEGKKSIARIGLWESGDCDVEVVEM